MHASAAFFTGRYAVVFTTTKEIMKQEESMKSNCYKDVLDSLNRQKIKPLMYTK